MSTSRSRPDRPVSDDNPCCSDDRGDRPVSARKDRALIDVLVDAHLHQENLERRVRVVQCERIRFPAGGPGNERVRVFMHKKCYGVCWRKLLAHPQTEHDSVCIEDQCERRLYTYEAQSQSVPVEALRSLYINNSYKSNYVVVTEFGMFNHATIMIQLIGWRKNGTCHNVSIMRQASLLRDFDPKRGISVTTLAYEYPAEFQVPQHAHGADQLIYAICGE